MAALGQDNYAALNEKWRKAFLTWEHEKQVANVGVGTLTDKSIELTYFNQPYWIDRDTGRIFLKDSPEEAVAFNTQMAIYHLLYYAKEHPVNSGRWVPFRGVRGAAPFDAAFRKNVLMPFAQAFNGKVPALEKVGETLGFKPIAHHGDAAFYVPAFACIPMQFIFWDGDEELSPEFNILFDYNITDFTHEETVVMMAEDGVNLFIHTLEHMEQQ